jgi:hypothetical protein
MFTGGRYWNEIVLVSYQEPLGTRHGSPDFSLQTV